MRKSQFLGITILNPGEGLDSDNYAFTGRDRELIDYGIRLGAKQHRHTGLPGLADPSAPASASVTPSAGFIPAGLTISVGYSYEDAQGGETRISPTVVVSTGSPLEVPALLPTAVLETGAGSLTIGTYYYAMSYLDAEGGETPVGGTVTVNRPAGSETAQVKLSGLSTGWPSGVVGYRLYRAVNGGAYDLLTEGTAATFTDDGTASVNCDIHPQSDSVNTTKQTNRLFVPIPHPIESVATAAINLYASLGNDFSESSLLGSFPVSSAGATATFSELSFLDHSPPDVNTSFGGAGLIDPDSELLSFHWKSPVAASGVLPSGSLGDVRLVTGTGNLFGVLKASAFVPSDWVHIGSAAPTGGGGASANLIASGGATKVSAVEELQFAASGGESVNVSSPGAGKALITIGRGPSTLAASGGVTKVPNVEELQFVGSGTAIDVSKPSTGIALIKVTQGTPRLRVAASGSATAPAAVNGVELIEIVGSGGINFVETESGSGKLKLIAEGMAAAIKQEGMGVIHHGTEASATRPTAFRQYTWLGTVKPNNMVEFDLWIEA